MEEHMTEERNDCELQSLDCARDDNIADCEFQEDSPRKTADEFAVVVPPTESPSTASPSQNAEQAPTPVAVENVEIAQEPVQGETLQSDATASPQSEIPNPQSEIPTPQSGTPTVESVLEAILFASDEPLTDSRLAGIVEVTTKQVRDCIDSLNKKYEAAQNAFRIEQIAGGFQMLTLNIYNEWLKKMLRDRGDNKLSPAALETLAIIAYKQPVIRADIESIRGVAVGEVLRSLMGKGLVKIAGRAEVLGHPMLYGTTKKFLEVFGLNSIKDLPKAEELKRPEG
jgi:segregation and condensation protein B